MQTARNRATQLVRSNRVGIAVAIVVALAVVSGTAIGAWRAHISKKHRAEVVGRANEIREVTRFVIAGEHDLAGKSAEARRHDVQNALESLDRHSQNAAGEGDLLRALAEAYETLAATQSGPTGGANTAGAIDIQQKAIAMREQIASISRSAPADTQALASAYLTIAQLYVTSGAPQTAAAYLQQAIPILESLLASNPTEQVRLLCATAYLNIGRLCGSLGNSAIGDTRAALAYIRGALKMQQALAADFPQNLAYQHGLAATYDALAVVYSAMGEPEGALEQGRKAVSVARALVAAEPRNPSHRRLLAEQLERTGRVLMQLNDKAQAQEHFREAQTLDGGSSGDDAIPAGGR